MSDASQPPREDDGDDGPEGPSRGFFGRILDALNPQEEAERPFGSAPREPPSLGNLRRMRVEDVAVPKAEIVAVPATIALPRLVGVFRDSGRTRIPVYEGSLDEPLGMVNLKDVALRHGFGQGGAQNADPTASGGAGQGGDQGADQGGPGEAPFDLRAMLRPLLYVPPSMPLAVLLQRMQAERIHMALVIDEWGGTDGLATIEDLLETVVGEIDDEHDVAERQTFAREGEGVWVAEGGTDLVEFEREIGMDLTAHEEIDTEEVDTLGGLVFLLSGHVPQAGEVVEHPDGPLFEVLDSDSRRVKRLRVRLAPAEAA